MSKLNQGILLICTAVVLGFGGMIIHDVRTSDLITSKKLMADTQIMSAANAACDHDFHADRVNVQYVSYNNFLLQGEGYGGKYYAICHWQNGDILSDNSFSVRRENTGYTSFTVEQNINGVI